MPDSSPYPPSRDDDIAQTALRLRLLAAQYDCINNRDLARRAGVTAETISRAMHGRRYVSPATIKRIEDAIVGREAVSL